MLVLCTVVFVHTVANHSRLLCHLGFSMYSFAVQNAVICVTDACFVFFNIDILEKSNVAFTWSQLLFNTVCLPFLLFSFCLFFLSIPSISEALITYEELIPFF